MEKWKTIDSHLWISSLGRVKKSTLTGYEFVHPQKDTRGLLFIVYDKKKIWLGRMVAELHIPNPENKPNVRVISENYEDMSITNLEWATMKEIAQAKRWKYGKSYGHHPEIVGIDIKTRIAFIFATQAQAARVTGCHNSAINHCLRGERKTSHGHKWFYADYYDSYDKEDVVSIDNRFAAIGDGAYK